jgi:uncharacterized coiled-coil DUF342 family protein
MRTIIFLLLLAFIPRSADCQKPSKAQMQSQMSQFSAALNKQIADLEKQIADAKKNNEDPNRIKQLEDGLAMLKKQAAQISGFNKGISNTSTKLFRKQLKKKMKPLQRKISKE